MPLITKADLATHIYEEIITEITRDNDDLITAAIAVAIDEAKFYLARFDIDALFGIDEPPTPPTVSAPYLINMVKDLAIYHICKLGNPTIHLEIVTQSRDTAIANLRNLMKGGVAPPNWPYKNEVTAAANNADTPNAVLAAYAAKRGNNI
jgi:hypothetical protein